VLIELLYASARSRPDHPALRHGEDRVTYAELAERVERLAHGLAARGVRAGDAVGVALPNGPDFVTCFFTITGLGASIVPVNPQFKRDELEFSLRTTGARTVIAGEESLAVCEAIARAPESDLQIVATGRARGDASLDALVEDNDPLALLPRGAAEPAMQQFSSGSTGRPKRLVRTHGQLAAEARTYTWVTGEDRVFCAVPLFHTYGLGCCLLAAMRDGATLVIMREPNPFLLQRERALGLLESERITVFPGVPFHFRLLAEAPGDADLSGLRLCFSAGTALERPAFDAFRRRFGVAVRQLYGCTEAGTLTANLDPDPVATFETAGRPVGAVQVAIEDGEIVVASPALTAGYADLSALNRRAFRDGRFRTGDLGRLDDAGRLTVTGRKKQLIEVGGYKVDPVEVQDVVCSHPKVREAVVLGVRSGDTTGETVKAVVVRDAGLSDRELIRYCREHLAGFKVPQIVECREEIPRSPLGKVLRKYLL
jgi:long-chain acyl-CoA synthetase